MKPKKKISAKEAKFRAMTKAQKRVAIAKDVLAALSAKKIKAEVGAYLEVGPKGMALTEIAAETIHRPDFESVWKMPLPADNDELRDVVKGQKCTACAIGSLFTCMLVRHDRFKVRDAGHDMYYDYLEKFFDEWQLIMIETAFEYSWMTTGGEEARAFGRRYKSATTRLVAIMKNIIKNEGTFVP